MEKSVLALYLRQILTDLKNSFTGTLCGQFAIKLSPKIPQHLKRGAALRCKVYIFKNCTNRSRATANLTRIKCLKKLLLVDVIIVWLKN